SLRAADVGVCSAKAVAAACRFNNDLLSKARANRKPASRRAQPRSGPRRPGHPHGRGRSDSGKKSPIEGSTLRHMEEVAILRITGGKANAMSAELLDAIERLIDGFEAGPARAAVIIGYERFFSAGLALPALIDLDR